MKQRRPAKLSTRIHRKYEAAKLNARLIKEFAGLAIRHPKQAKRAIDNISPMTGAMLGVAGAGGAVFVARRLPKYLQKKATQGTGVVAQKFTKVFGTHSPEVKEWKKMGTFFEQPKAKAKMEAIAPGIYGIRDKKGRLDTVIHHDGW